MNLEVDLDDVQRFAEDELSDFLVSHTTDFATAAFILQAVLDAVKEAKKCEE